MTFLLIIVAVIAVIVYSRKSSDEGSTSSRQYDLGYWAGRRDLRREVMRAIKDAKTVHSSKIQAVIDKNQWYPEGSEESATVEPVLSKEVTSATHTQNVTTRQESTQPVDYSVGLLYLGAFLFVASASLFVLISGVRGSIKTLVVIGISLLLYGVGITLYRHSRRLMSVGSTFAAIGLLVAPLAGIAAYGYWFNQTHGTVIWLLTSLACAALYTHALYRIRSEYIGYLLIGVAVSLVESSFSQLGLSSYYLAWGLMLVSVLSLAASHLMKHRQLGKVIEIPFMISALLFVPTSLLWSLALIVDHGTTQFIFSLYFAAIYYLVYGWLLGTGFVRQVCWLASQVAFLLAGGVWVYTISDSRMVLSIYLASSTVVYVAASLVRLVQDYIPNHHQGILGLSSLLLLATIFATATWPITVFAVVCVGVVTSWLQWRSTRQIYCAVLAQVLLLSTPGLLGWYVLKDRIEPVWVSAFYMILALALAGIERLRSNLELKIQYIIEAGYVLSSIAAFYIATMYNGYMAAFVACAAALLAYNWAQYHKKVYVSLVGHALLYIAVLAFYTEAKLGAYTLGIGWLTLSALLYVAQDYVKNEQWRISLRLSAMAGLVLTSFIGKADMQAWYFGPLSLVLLSAAVFYEAALQKKYVLKEVAAPIAMVALQWMLSKFGVDEFLVYSHLWAGLLLALGLFRLRRKERSYFDAYLWLSLITVTVPFALMLLGGADLVYGWIFIAEHILIVLIGVVFKKASVIWWGLVATVLAVLYQLRELQFIALGILSIFVLSIAVYLALKHQKTLE